MPHSKGPIAAVYGSSQELKEDEADYAAARRLGRALAEAGYVVATGGYHGAMEAASRGAKEGGGRTIGVTTSVFDGVRLGANPYVDEEVKFPTLFQRLHHLVTLADVWIALPGGIGTLSELALTWSLLQVGELARRPLVVVGPMWRAFLQAFLNNGHVRPHVGDLIAFAETVEDVLPLLKQSA